MNDYYRQSYVFERIGSATAIRYVCYEDLRSGKFSASRGDILRKPEHTDTLSLQAQWEVDSFMEKAPDTWFDTLLEAVENIAPIFHKERAG